MDSTIKSLLTGDALNGYSRENHRCLSNHLDRYSLNEGSEMILFNTNKSIVNPQLCVKYGSTHAVYDTCNENTWKRFCFCEKHISYILASDLREYQFAVIIDHMEIIFLHS